MIGKDDIERLLKEAIRLEHFSTFPPYLRIARIDDPAVEVRAWMHADEFDVAPVQRESEAPIEGFVRRSDLDRLATDQSIAAAVYELQEAPVADKNLSFDEAVALLDLHPWLLVGEGSAIRGIVTRWDLQRPAVSLMVLGKILTIEAGLRRLLGSYSGTPLPDAPIGERDEFAYVSRLVKPIKEQDELWRDLAYASKSKFDEAMKPIVTIRNHIAHGRNWITSEEKFDAAMERLRGINDLLEKIHRLAVDREQIWDAYEGTRIVQRVVEERPWNEEGSLRSPETDRAHVLTAMNPNDQVQSDRRNAERNKALREFLEARGLDFEEVFGESPNGGWSEASFAVQGLTRTEACRIARLFGQRAIFEFDGDAFRVVASDGAVMRERSRRI